MNITIYRSSFQNDSFNQYLESLIDHKLKYLASDLSEYGAIPTAELRKAIERSIQVCKTTNISVRKNFKAVYISTNGQLICDWRISKLGLELILLNADPSTEFVANYQLEIINRANYSSKKSAFFRGQSN
jgi:hypothetical protein